MTTRLRSFSALEIADQSSGANVTIAARQPKEKMPSGAWTSDFRERAGASPISRGLLDFDSARGSVSPAIRPERIAGAWTVRAVLAQPIQLAPLDAVGKSVGWRRRRQRTAGKPAIGVQCDGHVPEKAWQRTCLITEHAG